MQAVEFALFTLLVLSTFGILGREATIFYGRLADLLTFKHSFDFDHMLFLMSCSLSFSLLCSASLAIQVGQTIKFSECLFISTELCLVESHTDFSV